MKKKFLGSILSFMVVSFVVFSVVPKANAQTTKTMNPIFKIQSYSYDKLSNKYTLEQYGSAVLIANNILLTNVHVITDSNNGLTLQFEACQTISDQESPKCFSTLQLLKYDKNSDLALLQIINPSNNMPDPVIMWSGTLNVGDAIHIIGYPANGGTTITTTQGTIAWFENNYYKTDANVDEWNSWWGSFDNAWEFIGIPTFVVNGQTTLWYIIPTDTIKKFIAWGIGTTYTQKYSSLFDQRIKSVYMLQTRWIIDNTLFTTPDFSGIGLKLDSAIEKKSNNLYRYSFSNKNDSYVDLMSLIATDNTAVTKYINDAIKDLTDRWFAPKRSTKRIGTTTRTVISFGDSDRVGYDYVQTTSTTKTYLEFTVLVDKADVASDLSDLIQFVEKTTLKKSYIKPQVFNLPMIKLSSKWNISIVKYFNDNWLSINIFPSNGKYVTEVSAYMGGKWDTLKIITTQLRNTYDGMGLTTTSETSKYPWSVSVTSVVDENNKISSSVLGVKKYGSSTIFIHINGKLSSSSAKKEAIALAYKILGLE